MRKLSIKLIDTNNGKVLDSIVVDHCDICNRSTVFIWNKPKDIQFWFAEVDHWNLMEGIITIYYKSGVELEITRLIA